MNIKEKKYTHSVTLLNPKGKVVTRYTDQPTKRGSVLLDCGFTPLEGQTELVFEQINEPKIDPITPEASVDTTSTVDSLDPVVDTVSDMADISSDHEEIA
jgi:hypothetical protein